jgi:hypothetical protein
MGDEPKPKPSCSFSFMADREARQHMRQFQGWGLGVTCTRWLSRIGLFMTKRVCFKVLQYSKWHICRAQMDNPIHYDPCEDVTSNQHRTKYFFFFFFPERKNHHQSVPAKKYE